MEQNDAENVDGRSGFFSLNLFKRKTRIARKSAPSFTPGVAPSLLDGNEDSAPQSDDELPLLSGRNHAGGKPNTTPSLQLRHESKLNGSLSHKEAAEVLAAFAGQAQHSSPSKSVHFNDKPKEDRGSTQESPYHLRSSKPGPQQAKEKPSKPTGAANASDGEDGNDLNVLPSGRASKSRVAADTHDVDDSHVQTRSQSAALHSSKAHRAAGSTRRQRGEGAATARASSSGKRPREENQTDISTARSSRRSKTRPVQRPDDDDEPLFEPESNGASYTPQEPEKAVQTRRTTRSTQRAESEPTTLIGTLVRQIIGGPRGETIDEEEAHDPGVVQDEDAMVEIEKQAHEERADDSEYIEDEEAEEVEPEVEPNTFGYYSILGDVDRLYGHQSALDDVFHRVKTFSRDKRGRLKSEKLDTIAHIERLCKRAATTYECLRVMAEVEPSPDEIQELLEGSLPLLSKLIAALDPDRKTRDEDNKELAEQVYVYVFPALVDALEQAIAYYNDILMCYDRSKQMPLDSLSTLFWIYNIFETLDSKSRRWKTKPRTSLNVVRPLRYGVIAPLRSIFADLQREARKARAREAESKASHELAQSQRRKLDDELLEAQKEAIRYEKIDRLRALYLARMSVENDVRRRLIFLRMPKLNQSLREIDFNGDEFERMPLFGARVAPHMPEYREIEGEEWAEEERRALMEGLKNFKGTKSETSLSRSLTSAAGNHMWFNIFQVYCRPHAPLRGRNVAEILKQAKYMRDTWIQWDADHGGETEDYIVNIPDLDLLGLL